MKRAEQALARARRHLNDAQIALTAFRASERHQVRCKQTFYEADSAAQDLLSLDLKLKLIQEKLK